MTSDRYTLAQFIEDLREVVKQTADERTILKLVRPLVKRLALDKSWVTSTLYQATPEQGFGLHLLHEESDHTLAVFAMSWLPKRGTPPHNHRTWAVVAGVDGMEKNSFWERTDDGSRPGCAELRLVSETQCAAGDVIAMLPDDIHAVINETDRVTLSLHVYGKHINYTGRSQFNPDKKTETPFVLKIEQAGFRPFER
jgi:predicted metal-dependent enzyme (double-stranded beta helix superfamily)